MSRFNTTAAWQLSSPTIYFIILKCFQSKPDSLSISWTLFYFFCSSIIFYFFKKHWKVEKLLHYRYYYGVFVQASWNNHPKVLFVRNTRFSKGQHPFAVKLDKNRTNALAKSFIPMTTGFLSPSFPRSIAFSCSKPTSTDNFDSSP